MGIGKGPGIFVRILWYYNFVITFIEIMQLFIKKKKMRDLIGVIKNVTHLFINARWDFFFFFFG